MSDTTTNFTPVATFSQSELEPEKSKPSQNSKDIAVSELINKQFDMGMCLGLSAMWVERRSENRMEGSEDRIKNLKNINVRDAVELQLLQEVAIIQQELAQKHFDKLSESEHLAKYLPNINSNTEDQSTEYWELRKARDAEQKKMEQGLPVNDIKVTQKVFSARGMEAEQCQYGMNNELLAAKDCERFKKNAMALTNNPDQYYLFSLTGEERDDRDARQSHAMVFYRGTNTSYFFDPNEGEYRIKTDKLEDFFAYVYNDYATSPKWKGIAKYNIMKVGKPETSNHYVPPIASNNATIPSNNAPIPSNNPPTFPGNPTSGRPGVSTTRPRR